MGLIGVDTVSLYSGWKKNPDSTRLKPDMIERISHTLAIFESLNVLLPAPKPGPRTSALLPLNWLSTLRCTVME